MIILRACAIMHLQSTFSNFGIRYGCKMMRTLNVSKCTFSFFLKNYLRDYNFVNVRDILLPEYPKLTTGVSPWFWVLDRMDSWWNRVFSQDVYRKMFHPMGFGHCITDTELKQQQKWIKTKSFWCLLSKLQYLYYYLFFRLFVYFTRLRPIKIPLSPRKGR